MKLECGSGKWQENVMYHNLNTPMVHPNILYFPINLIC